MQLKVKNTFIVVDEQSIQNDEEDSSSGPRMTQSLPNSPRLGSSAKADNSDTTSVDDTESKETGYDTPDEFLETGYDTPDEVLDESQSEFGRCWLASPEDALSCGAADPCVWQGWMISNMAPFHMHGLGDGLCAPEWATQEAEEPTVWNNEVTVMMRNVPKKLTQHALLDEINSRGFAGTYDFLYLPMDQDSKVNRGYAFINFMDPAYAASFKAFYEGRQLNQYSSRKFIAILPAVLQGFEANREHFSTRRVSREDPGARPLFLREMPASAKSSEVPEQCRAIRAEGAVAKPVASTLKPRLRAESRTVAAPVSVGETQTSTGQNEPVVKFCPYCGGSVGEGFKFCQYCGKSLSL